jgi:hypothetical protein
VAWLERLKKNQNPTTRAVEKVKKGAFFTFSTALSRESQLFETACPTCGATAWRETPDGGQWCEPCVIAGRVPIVAVKIHSDILDALLWVVADDLPREQWPQEGTPVYTHHEVQMLRQAGPNMLQWVHAAMQALGATVAR